MTETTRLSPNCAVLAMGALADQRTVATGEPTYCEGCRCVLSNFSVLVEEDEGEYDWTCEFCRHKNEGLMLQPEEIPKSSCLDYLLEPAPARGEEDSYVVYCIDVSGSMCVTTEVPALQAEWKNSKKAASGGSKAKSVPADQYLPGESRDKSYISRMECMKLAVDTQLKRLVVKYPTKKVAVITFSSDVVVVGDGSGVPETITGDMLEDFDALRKRGRKYRDGEGVKTVEKSGGDLAKAVEKMEEGGATALGPSAAIAYGICEGFPGSEIIICTDGKANIGLGGDEENDEANGQYFEKLGRKAKKAGVTISIVSIQTIAVDRHGNRSVVKEESSECGLAHLKNCANLTGGDVTILHPLELVRQIRKLSQNPVVASDVSVGVLTHPILVLDEQTTAKGLSREVKKLGTVHQDQDFSYSFALRKEKRGSKFPKHLVFQVHVTFTADSGAKLMRVITKRLRTSVDREQAEKDMDTAVVAIANVHRVAQMMEAGDHIGARLHLRSTHLLMERCGQSDPQCEEISEFVERTKELDRELRSVMRELHRRGITSTAAAPATKKSKSSKSKKGKASSGDAPVIELSDKAVEAMQRAKGANQATYLSGERKKDLCLRRKGDEA
eukprot:CAMPEP_0119128714 /NCGR_PEP_ID=MMETSP1310-20130426/6756_1 /TAXON_ID=464262 /ORGANISM="Genus nov. species nov., Strain RCC2339" /LENGTH=613 /DNA_ID=CAMNT_0007119079 /DNA_START=17 /DNA_END=1855 /DNA_ORIENTATION=+